jgi:hypothetical protein
MCVWMGRRTGLDVVTKENILSLLVIKPRSCNPESTTLLTKKFCWMCEDNVRKQFTDMRRLISGLNRSPWKPSATSQCPCHLANIPLRTRTQNCTDTDISFWNHVIMCRRLLEPVCLWLRQEISAYFRHTNTPQIEEQEENGGEDLENKNK